MLESDSMADRSCRITHLSVLGAVYGKERCLEEGGW